MLICIAFSTDTEDDPFEEDELHEGRNDEGNMNEDLRRAEAKHAIRRVRNMLHDHCPADYSADDEEDVDEES